MVFLDCDLCCLWVLLQLVLALCLIGAGMILCLVRVRYRTNLLHRGPKSGPSMCPIVLRYPKYSLRLGFCSCSTLSSCHPMQCRLRLLRVRSWSMCSHVRDVELVLPAWHIAGRLFLLSLLGVPLRRSLRRVGSPPVEGSSWFLREIVAVFFAFCPRH